jgi:hypothetical protein
MRSTPLFPLTTPEADPENLIIKGKALREGVLAAEPGISDNFPSPSVETPYYLLLFLYHTFCWSFSNFKFLGVFLLSFPLLVWD